MWLVGAILDRAAIECPSLELTLVPTESTREGYWLGWSILSSQCACKLPRGYFNEVPIPMSHTSRDFNRSVTNSGISILKLVCFQAIQIRTTRRTGLSYLHLSYCWRSLSILASISVWIIC